jgi:tetratricopeptide (TPR) repeat protein
MQEKINLRFLVILLAALVALGVGWQVLHAFQVRRTSSALLTQASKAEEGEKPRLDHSALFLERYLILKPDNTEVRVRYANLLEKLAEASKDPRLFRQAESVFESILNRAPKRHDIRRRLALMQARSERLDLALDHFKKLHEAYPAEGEIEYWLGRCYESQRDNDRAIEHYESAISDSKQVGAYSHLAKLLQATDPNRADQKINELVELNKTDAKAYLERAAFLKDQGKLSDAAKDVAQALALAPDDADVLLAAGETAQLQQNLKSNEIHLAEKPEQYFERAIKQNPHRQHAYRAWASLEMQSGHLDKAIALLEKGLKEVMDPAGQRDLCWSLAYAHLERRDVAKARPIIQQLRDMLLFPAQLGFIEGYCYFRESKWLDASRALDIARPSLMRSMPDLATQADFLLAECYSRMGDLDKQSTVFRQVLETTPDSIPALYGLVNSLWNNGNIDEALARCRQMMDQPTAPRSGWLTLAQLMIAHNLRVGRSAQKWDLVDNILSQAEQLMPDSPEPAILRAESAVHQNRRDEAKKILQAAKERFPKSYRPWTALAHLSADEKRLDEAEKTLAQAETLLGFSVDLCLARLAIFAKVGGTQAEEVLANTVAYLDRAPKEDKILLVRGLAEGYYRIGKVDEARRWWTELLGSEPRNRGLRLTAFDLALRADDEDGMRREIQELKAIENSMGPLAHYAEARRLLWRATRGETQLLPEAASHLDAAEQQKPDWPAVALARAHLKELQEDPDGAVEHYLQVIRSGEPSLATIERAVELLTKRQRYFEADKILQELAKQSPLTGNLQQLSAHVALQAAAASLIDERDFQLALRRARNAVASNPENYKAHMVLGQILSAGAAQPDGQQLAQEAEDSLRRAVKMAENEPETWVALVQHLARVKKMDKAEEAQRQAQERLPKDKAPLAMARCWEVLGDMNVPDDMKKAREFYDQAVAAQPGEASTLRLAADFYLRVGLRNDALQLLKQIITGFKDKSPGDADSARQKCAAVMAATGTYAEKREALEMLGILPTGEISSAGKPVSFEEKRARALVLATRPDFRSRRNAIKILEDLSHTRQGLSADEHLVLAQLYELTGDWVPSRDQMIDVLALNDKEPIYLSAYAKSLLRRDLLDDAQIYIEKLQRASNDAMTDQTAELKAQLLAARDEHAQAVAGLRGYLDDGKAIPTDPLKRLELVGRILEDLSETYPQEKSYVAAAEDVFRRFANKSHEPERVLALAWHLGRHGRMREALEICERAWQTCPAEKVGSTTLTVLHSGRVGQEEYDKVERLIAAVLEKQPNNLALQVCLADLKDVECKFDQAVELYRAILNRNSQDLVALNNLAWLLAHDPPTAAESIELSRKAIEIAGPMAELVDTQVVAMLTAGQIQESITMLKEALADPTLVRNTAASMHFHLARAYKAANRNREADLEMAEAQKKGLNAARIHPRERDIYDELVQSANSAT